MLELMVGQTSSDEELLEQCGRNDDSPDGGPGVLKMPPYFTSGSQQHRSRSKKSVLKPLTELSEEERAEKLKQQSLTNEYHKFVEGHLILKQGEFWCTALPLVQWKTVRWLNFWPRGFADAVLGTPSLLLLFLLLFLEKKFEFHEKSVHKISGIQCLWKSLLCVHKWTLLNVSTKLVDFSAEGIALNYFSLKRQTEILAENKKNTPSQICLVVLGWTFSVLLTWEVMISLYLCCLVSKYRYHFLLGDLLKDWNEFWKQCRACLTKLLIDHPTQKCHSSPPFFPHLQSARKKAVISKQAGK